MQQCPPSPFSMAFSLLTCAAVTGGLIPRFSMFGVAIVDSFLLMNECSADQILLGEATKNMLPQVYKDLNTTKNMLPQV